MQLTDGLGVRPQIWGGFGRRGRAGSPFTSARLSSAGVILPIYMPAFVMTLLASLMPATPPALRRSRFDRLGARPCGLRRGPAEQAAPLPPTVTVAKPAQAHHRRSGRICRPLRRRRCRSRCARACPATSTRCISQDGQIVKQGDLLFTIDKRPFQNTLDQARANLETARSNLVFHPSRPCARPAAGARPDHQRADLRAAVAGQAQCPGRGCGERGGGAPGRARSRVHRAAGSGHRPHRRPARHSRQPRDRRHRRLDHAACHDRLASTRSASSSPSTRHRYCATSGWPRRAAPT